MLKLHIPATSFRNKPHLRIQKNYLSETRTTETQVQLQHQQTWWRRFIAYTQTTQLTIEKYLYMHCNYEEDEQNRRLYPGVDFMRFSNEKVVVLRVPTMYHVHAVSCSKRKSFWKTIPNRAVLPLILIIIIKHVFLQLWNWSRWTGNLPGNLPSRPWSDSSLGTFSIPPCHMNWQSFIRTKFYLQIYFNRIYT